MPRKLKLFLCDAFDLCDEIIAHGIVGGLFGRHDAASRFSRWRLRRATSRSPFGLYVFG